MADGALSEPAFEQFAVLVARGVKPSQAYQDAGIGNLGLSLPEVVKATLERVHALALPRSVEKPTARVTTARPTEPTADLIADFCDRIAAGTSIQAVCADPAMPARRTIFRWLREDEEFRALYDRAVEERAETIFEDALAIADDDSGDYVETDKGRQFDGQNVKRSALRVETRFKFLAKLLPGRYGDKLNVSGSIAVPVRFIIEGGPQTIDVKANRIPESTDEPATL